MDMLKQALRTLPMDRKQIIDSVTDAVLEAVQAEEQREERGEVLLERLRKKREAALDAFFSQDITREELRQMTERYDREIAELQAQPANVRRTVISETDIRSRLTAILDGETDSQAFWKTLLAHMVVYRNRREEVRLNLLPQTWIFTLGRTAQNDPDVPISVSRPLSSG